MAAVNPNGDMKYWFFGLPYEGSFHGSDDMGTIKYWYFGLPGPIAMPAGGGGGGGPGVKRLTLLGAG